ncbi:MAG TPA: type VI secretion system tip protein TssI/VgrG, partial [Candidatus Nanopelagicales bacterium]|nr:type VI secretion system tip protein TssI/VgrG [Candidatus Nanopelagicales bacterium]
MRSGSLVELSLACDERLAVHRFTVREAVSELFSIKVLARCHNPVIDLKALLGERAELHLVDHDRRWCGVCDRARLVEAVDVGEGEVGLSTYEISIVPKLWLLSRRTRYRIFQHRSTPSIVCTLLEQWGLLEQATWLLQQDDHPARPYRVQYGETDLDYLSRLLEEAGIAYRFDDESAEGTQLVLSDTLHESAPRRGTPLLHVEHPTERTRHEYATRVCVTEELRPEAVVLRDHDFQRPTWSLVGEAHGDSSAAALVERYEPGAFLLERGTDRAAHDDRHGATLARRTLDSLRLGGCSISFETNAADVRPGTVVSIEGHPHPALDASAGLLITRIEIDGSPEGEWSIRAQAVPASTSYRPPRRTAKPRVVGVQSATVVGPRGQEIHTDDHGRVRVQFPWDRDAQGSCWLRVVQGWAGAGLGLFALPRVGQEVLVAFLEGDPDQPVVVGRVSNPLNPPPLKLPEEKTQSVWRSGTTPGGEGYSEIRFEDEK